MPKLLFAHGPHVATFEPNLPAHNRAVAPEELHDCECHGGLAATGFTYDAVRLPRHELEVEVHHGRDLAAAREERNGEIPALDDRHRLAPVPASRSRRHHRFSPHGSLGPVSVHRFAPPDSILQ